FHYFAKDSVVARKPWCCGHGDKELRPVGPGAGIGHRQLARLIKSVRGAFGLIAEFIAWASHSCAAGIAALDHEVRNHAVKNRSAIERPGAAFPAHAVFPWALALGEIDEVLGGDGRFFFKQAADNLAFCRVKHGVCSWLARHWRSSLMRCGQFMGSSDG